MSVVTMVMSIIFVIIYMWVFTRVMNFIGRLLRVGEGTIAISNFLKNKYVRPMVCILSLIVFVLIYIGLVDKMFGVIAVIILFLALFDLRQLPDREGGTDG